MYFSLISASSYFLPSFLLSFSISFPKITPFLMYLIVFQKQCVFEAAGFYTLSDSFPVVSSVSYHSDMCSVCYHLLLSIFFLNDFVLCFISIFFSPLFLLMENYSRPLFPAFTSLQHRAGNEYAIWRLFFFPSPLLTGNCKVAFPHLPLMLKVLDLCGLFALPVEFMEC